MEYVRYMSWDLKKQRIRMRNKAIAKSLKFRDMAVARATKVGAAVYTNNRVFGGFNIENRCHKGYHAEEVALINYKLSGCNDPILGIVVAFSDDPDEFTFACGHCLQLLWESTMDTNTWVSAVNTKGKILGEKLMWQLYCVPYPNQNTKEKIGIAKS